MDSVRLFKHSQFIEERGEIFSFWKKRDLDLNFVEDRCSVSYRGTVRGLHGDPETWKYITCPIGELFLVTYSLKTGEKLEFYLTEAAKTSILIPPYHINGHQCLSHFCIFSYKQTQYYDAFPAETQWTVRYDDPQLNINWPIKPMRVSERDKQGKLLKDLNWENN